MADHMASENIWIKGKLLSRAFLRYGKFLFMFKKDTFSHVLIFEIFWYDLNGCYSIVLKKLNFK